MAGTHCRGDALTLCGGDVLWWGRLVAGTLCGRGRFVAGDASWGDGLWRGRSMEGPIVEGRFVEAPKITSLLNLSSNNLYKYFLVFSCI